MESNTYMLWVMNAYLLTFYWIIYYDVEIYIYLDKTDIIFDGFIWA
jgi:hypothetical protein